MALHVVTLHPFHPADIYAHGERGGENLAQAYTDIPPIVGVRLSRTSRIVCAEESSLFIFEFLFVGISSIEPCSVTEVMVNPAAVLVRIVGQKADGTPVVL